MALDQALIRQMSERVQEELTKKEMETVQNWLGELERILEKRHRDMASLQLDLTGLRQRFQNRLKMLRSARG
jgi:TATA-binding protein-associated factor Taf7